MRDNVDAQIRRIDFDIDIIINFRETNAELNDVWRRPPESNGLLAPGGERRFLYAASHKRNRRSFDRYGFNTRHFTFRLFDDFILKPRDSAQRRYIRSSMLAQPVLPYRQTPPEYRGSSRRCQFAREHTAELKLRQFFFQSVGSATASLKVSSSSASTASSSDQKHLPAPVSFGRGCRQRLRGGTLFTQRLCAFGFVPDIRRSSSAFTSSRRSFLAS